MLMSTVTNAPVRGASTSAPTITNVTASTVLYQYEDMKILVLLQTAVGFWRSE